MDKRKDTRKLVQRKRNTKRPLTSYIANTVAVAESANLEVKESCCWVNFELRGKIRKKEREQWNWHDILCVIQWKFQSGDVGWKNTASKKPVEFLGLILCPWKFQPKQTFTPGNSAELCYTPSKFQGQKPRPLEIPQIFSWRCLEITFFLVVKALDSKSRDLEFKVDAAFHPS